MRWRRYPPPRASITAPALVRSVAGALVRQPALALTVELLSQVEPCRHARREDSGAARHAAENRGIGELTFTGYWVTEKRICGPNGYTGYWIGNKTGDYEYIYGPDGYTGFYIDHNHVNGPDGYTSFYFNQRYLYGPERTPPWV